MDEERERYPTRFAISGVITHPSSNSDPIFISLISGILETIARSPSSGVYEALIKAALPALRQALESSGPDSSWISSSALDLLTGIIRGVDSGKGLGEGFFAAIAPPLFACLRGAEDRDVLQVRAHLLGRSVNLILAVRMGFLV